MQKIPELVCPAGNLPALKTAVDNSCGHGLHGFERCDQCTKLSGTEFRYEIGTGKALLRPCARAQCTDGYQYIRTKLAKWERWHAAVDTAAIWVPMRLLFDPTIMAYAADKHPNLRLHMSVQGSTTNYEAINMMKELFRHPSCRFAALC